MQRRSFSRWWPSSAPLRPVLPRIPRPSWYPIHTYGNNGPFRVPFDAALARTFRASTDAKVDFYVESLDFYRFGGSRSHG